ncbi:MAG: DUF4492 domain-containing protein [Prevotellaceae bacterium]|jgi:hypothetical protein|nr:DUF4492 domain-containing protein [Prevotellaceae bacterium]
MNTTKKVFQFYYTGFKNMTVGKTLWAIILIKLFIMFAILKPLFFPNLLSKNFDTAEQKSNYVFEQLTTTPKQ